MRRILHGAHLSDRFAPMQIGDDEYHANFPFVEQENEHPVKIIKPLHLAHSQPSKILDHGGQWLFRINQLKKRDLLPDQVLFAVDVPKEAHSPRANAAFEIVDALIERGIDVAPIEDRQKVISFALR